MGGKVKKVVITVLVLTAVAAVVGYKMWNKPHQDVRSSEGIKVAADVLYTSFVNDSAAANKKYIGKVVEVSGTVQNVSVNQQKQKVVSLKTAAGGAYVNCTMEQPDAAVKEGNAIIVKGVCSGLGQGDPDLGIMGDVYLTRCYLADQQ